MYSSECPRASDERTVHLRRAGQPEARQVSLFLLRYLPEGLRDLLKDSQVVQVVDWRSL